MSGGTSVLFRVATGDDWPGIWPIFRAVVSRGDTYMFDPEISEADAQAAWMLGGDERRRTYIAELDSDVVGTAILRPNHPELGDHVANAAWMIAPAHTGRGIGRRFAEFVIDEARSLGFTGMQFNAVVASNERAIALWKSLGFRIVGTVADGFRHVTLGPTDIHIMYRDL